MAIALFRKKFLIVFQLCNCSSLYSCHQLFFAYFLFFFSLTLLPFSYSYYLFLHVFVVSVYSLLILIVSGFGPVDCASGLSIFSSRVY